MKTTLLALAIATALATAATATDVYPRKRGYSVTPPERVPMALRTLNKRSAAVLASDPCWLACTGDCGAYFRQCLKVAWQQACFAHNGQCELTCLKHCRLYGGPLVSWTEW
jgi:hypothetical protein